VTWKPSGEKVLGGKEQRVKSSVAISQVRLEVRAICCAFNIVLIRGSMDTFRSAQMGLVCTRSKQKSKMYTAQLNTLPLTVPFSNCTVQMCFKIGMNPRIWY
jgi:hypothetical protein